MLIVSKEGKLAANIELKCTEDDLLQMSKQVAANVKQDSEFEHNEVVTRGWICRRK